MNCRHCQQLLEHVFLDLGFAPPSNAYLSAAALSAPERHFPLRLFVCGQCWLVQTDDCTAATDHFTPEYAYFSSTSTSWLRHAADYCSSVTARLQLDESSLVVELASNDGYLLRNFVAAGIPCLGIEPTASTAQVAIAQGIPVIQEFFGTPLARRLVAEGRQADLVVANNVFAHVPDINDFAHGIGILLATGGTLTLEFPHLLNLIALNQFDTVYHEHYSYLSLGTACRVLAAAGLRVFDVERLATHGGSLRVYACRHDDPRPGTHAVQSLLQEETAGGLQQLDTYAAFQPRADRAKDDFLAFLIERKRAGARVAAYGAAAKGNTLLNYAGVKPDLLPFVCDGAAAKQGRFLPGSHIPILGPEALASARPEYIVILPWNLKDEIAHQLAHARDWGARFVTAIPQLAID